MIVIRPVGAERFETMQEMMTRQNAAASCVFGELVSSDYEKAGI